MVEYLNIDAIFQNRIPTGETSHSFRAAIFILKPSRALRILIQRTKFPANQTSDLEKVYFHTCALQYRTVTAVTKKSDTALFRTDYFDIDIVPALLRPVSNAVVLPCRTKLIKLNTTLARRLKPSRATAV